MDIEDGVTTKWSQTEPVWDLYGLSMDNKNVLIIITRKVKVKQDPISLYFF